MGGRFSFAWSKKNKIHPLPQANTQPISVAVLGMDESEDTRFSRLIQLLRQNEIDLKIDNGAFSFLEGVSMANSQVFMHEFNQILPSFKEVSFPDKIINNLFSHYFDRAKKEGKDYLFQYFTDEAKYSLKESLSNLIKKIDRTTGVRIPSSTPENPEGDQQTNSRSSMPVRK